MSKIKKLIVPFALIIATIVVTNLIMANPPETKRRGISKAPQMTVEALTLQAKPYDVVIDSYGTVKPRTQSALVSQASGQIISISENFREGGFFEQGDVLVQLDSRDYEAEVNIAKAGLLSAEQTLLEEKARVEQAKIDWQRLDKDKPANDLVLRKPQLAAAQAKVLSAQAQLQKAQLALERTKIVAPFAGRILTKSVDVGQVISMNSKIADIYATDYVEIRLPIKNKDLDLVVLPEEYRDQQVPTHGQAVVTFRSDLATNQIWQGQLVRTEGAIDSNSQQLYVVAQIDEPFSASRNKEKLPLKIGQYVSAEIAGITLDEALVIPNKAIYQGSFVYLVEDGLLKRKNISVKWQNASDSIIGAGLKNGDKVVVSPLGQVSSGTPVSILGEKAPQRKRDEMGKGPKGAERGSDKQDRKARNKNGGES